MLITCWSGRTTVHHKTGATKMVNKTESTTDFENHDRSVGNSHGKTNITVYSAAKIKTSTTSQTRAGCVLRLARGVRIKNGPPFVLQAHRIRPTVATAKAAHRLR